MTDQPVALSSVEDGRAWLASFDAVLFDCDGVLWLGHDLVAGADEVIAALRSAGKRLFFVTNNATKSRDMYVERFGGFGIAVSRDEIVSSAWATAAYCRQRLLEAAPEESPSAFVVGEAGLCQELDECGVAWLGGTAYNGLSHAAVEQLDPQQHRVAAVIVGLDRDINYAKIAAAQQFLLRGSGARRADEMLFLASNPDRTYPFRDGVVLPGAGTAVAAIEACSGRKATVVGKPEGHMLDLIQQRHRLDAGRMLMVGDRLDTDIAFGARHGTQTLLVLTGVTKACDVHAADYKPAFVAQSVADMLRLF